MFLSWFLGPCHSGIYPVRHVIKAAQSAPRAPCLSGSFAAGTEGGQGHIRAWLPPTPALLALPVSRLSRCPVTARTALSSTALAPGSGATLPPAS